MADILILGAGGYLGKVLIEHLKKDSKNQIFAIDRNYVDLTNLEECKKLFSLKSFDEIYQFAANSGGIDYLMSDEYFYGSSTLINLLIIQSLKEINYKGRILFPSSFYAYDIKNRYGLEKLYNETLYLESGLDVRIPRLFSVYGPGEKINSPQEKVTTAFCRKAIKDENLILRGYPSQFRYFLHVDDAICGLIEHMKSNIVVTDIAGEDAIFFDRLIKTILNVAKKNIEVSWTLKGEMKKTHPPYNMKLNWKPKIKFEDGIAQLYGWVKNELS